MYNLERDLVTAAAEVREAHPAADARDAGGGAESGGGGRREEVLRVDAQAPGRLERRGGRGGCGVLHTNIVYFN